MLKRVLLGAGIAEADIVKRHHALGTVLRQGLGGSGVVDGGGGRDNLVNAVGGHTGARQHNGYHRQHQERHDDLHRVGDEGDHLADLHRAHIHGLAAEPDDEQACAVHDQRHKGHHGDHRAVGEKLGAHQVGVGTVEPLFLKGLAAEGADRHDAGQYFAADKVQPIHKGLHLLELGHGDIHQHSDEQQQRHHRDKDDPCQPRVAAGHMQDAADAEDRRIGHHAQQDNADELHLLNVVGRAGDERCSGKLLDLGVGIADNGAEHIAPQVTADGSRHAGGDEADSDRHSDHKQCQGQHPAAGAQQIAHLDIVGDALCLIFQRDQQHGLTRQAARHRIIERGKGGGQLALQHFPCAGGLRQRGKLGRNGIEVVDGGGCCIGRAGGGGGVFGGCHVQHNVRRGKRVFQFRHGSGGIVREGTHTVGIGGTVPLFGQRGVLLGHKQLQCLQGRVADGLGHRAFNAALLDADVHDLAGVVGQAQVAVGLYKQQRHHGDAGRPVTPQLLKYFDHARGLLSCLQGLAPKHRSRPRWRRGRRPSGPPSGPAPPGSAAP